MLKTILTIIFISTAMFCNAQEIKVEKYLGGPRFIENGQYISKRRLLAKMEPHSKAYQFMAIAKRNSNVSIVLGFIGGVAFGWQINKGVSSNNIRGNDINLGIAAGGLALGIASIPLARSANRKSLEAVRLYNLSSKSSFYKKPKAELNVIASGNKIGLSLKF